MPILASNLELEETQRLWPSSTIVAVEGHANSEGLSWALQGRGYKTARHIVGGNDTNFRYAVAVEGRLNKTQVIAVKSFAEGYLCGRR